MERWSFINPPEIERGSNHKNLVTQYENGREQVRNKFSWLTWTIRFNRSFTESEQFFAFYTARKGSCEAFEFVDQGIVYTVRFSQDSLSKTDFLTAASNYGITLKQVL
jgi:hypothetical protein